MGSDQSKPNRNDISTADDPLKTPSSAPSASDTPVDGGFLNPPPGLYTGGKNWKAGTVRKLIVRNVIVRHRSTDSLVGKEACSVLYTSGGA